MIEFFKKHWRNHGTKIIGAMTGTLGVLSSATTIFSAKIISLMMMVSGLLTFWRGFLNDIFKDET